MTQDSLNARLLAVAAEAGEPDLQKADERRRKQQDAVMSAAPFACLGHDDGTFYYLSRQSGQIIRLAAGSHTKVPLLQLADLTWWQSSFHKPGGQTDWERAADAVIRNCYQAGVFDRDRLRGRGVHIDRGRVVWHLGDRLEVDGTEQELIDFKSDFLYEAKARLPINTSVDPLTDQEGQQVLEIIRSMGWECPDQALYLAGVTVLSNVCGALPVRPQCQFTSPFGSGKSDGLERVVRPLQANVREVNVGSTEAGIRQANGTDVLPILIDESEQAIGESKNREGHLRMARYAFDGKRQLKGTPGHRQVEFTLRSTVFLSGINSELANPADRSRFVVVQRKNLSSTEWHRVRTKRSEFITRETGERLMRRTVSNLGVLLHNAKLLENVINSAFKPSNGRTAELYGLVLAGVHMLVSTERLSFISAPAWLKSIGWPHDAQLITGENLADEESRQCLDHLLTHSVRWLERREPEDTTPTTGEITVGELIKMIHYNREHASEARTALGRLGIKHHSDGRDVFVLVANGGAAIEKVFGKTKWCHGAHKKRLLELGVKPKPTIHGSTVHFSGAPAQRAVRIPIEVLVPVKVHHAPPGNPDPQPPSFVEVRIPGLDVAGDPAVVRASGSGADSFLDDDDPAWGRPSLSQTT